MSPSPLGAFYRSPLGAFYRSPLGAFTGPPEDEAPEVHNTEYESNLRFKLLEVEIEILDDSDESLLHTAVFTTEPIFHTGDDALVEELLIPFLDVAALAATSTPFGFEGILDAGFTERLGTDTAASHPGWTEAGSDFSVSIFQTMIATDAIEVTNDGDVVRLEFDAPGGELTMPNGDYEPLAGYALVSGGKLWGSVGVDSPMPASFMGDPDLLVRLKRFAIELEIL